MGNSGHKGAACRRILLEARTRVSSCISEQLDLFLFLWFSVYNQLQSHSFTLQTLLTCATQDDLVYTRIRYTSGPPGVSRVAPASKIRTSPAPWACLDSSLKTTRKQVPCA